MSIKLQAKLEGALKEYYRRIPAQVPKGIARGLNRAGTPTSKQFLREAKRALGIGRGRGMQNWKDPAKTNTTRKKAHPGRLSFLLIGFGKKLPLKYFKANETRRGVSATPMNVRKIHPGTFIKGGRFPNRKNIGKGDTVFKRVGRKRLPIEKQYGPAFPESFEQPTPKATWEREGSDRSVKAIIKELDAILKGYAK